MDAIRVLMLKSVSSSISLYTRTLPSRFSNVHVKVFDRLDVRSVIGYVGRNFHSDAQFRMLNFEGRVKCKLSSMLRFSPTLLNSYVNDRSMIDHVGHKYYSDSQCRQLNFESQVSAHRSKPGLTPRFSPALSHSHNQISSPVCPFMSILSYRSYSSFFGDKGHGSKGPELPEASGTGEVGVNGGASGTDLVNKLKDAWKSAVDGVTVTGQKAKEATDEWVPYVQELLDSQPYLKDVVVPVGGILSATLIAWLVMPKLLRRFHRYSTQGSVALLSGTVFAGEVPYEKSFWGAIEDPVRYVVTFMAFSQVCMMVAPDMIPSQYIAQAWKGAIILSFVWFLHRWKTNLFTRALAFKGVQVLDREKLLTLDKVSSVGLFIIGLMALAEACGVAVQSILTVGGIGGVATAFAARDVLGNVLSGLALLFTKPFSLGDTIKAGSIEGQVVEMGLTTTSLLNAEKFPVIVPNSMFSSQVITNKSRAQWRSFVTKVPFRLDDMEKVPQISNEIKSTLKSNPNVFLGKEAPYCYLSRVGSSYAELTLGCNLKHMSKEEMYATEQDILLHCIRIMKQHGASLASVYQEDTITG